MAQKSLTTSSSKPIPQKLRRNERERRRVNQVNQGFNKLRDRVPRQPGCKAKMSKVETLREAVKYIQYLQTQLEYVPCSTVSLPSTPDHSPSYPQPQSQSMDCSKSMVNYPATQASSLYYDPNNISPYYPMIGSVPANITYGMEHKSCLNGNVTQAGQQPSPGSSFYSDSSSNYDDHYFQ